jgi:hypothetical protein
MEFFLQQFLIIIFLRSTIAPAAGQRWERIHTISFLEDDQRINCIYLAVDAVGSLLFQLTLMLVLATTARAMGVGSWYISRLSSMFRHPEIEGVSSLLPKP